MEKLEYLTIEKNFQYEIPKIKGSRFFATLIPIISREQIDKELIDIRKKYFDATHNCYAWRFGVDANQDLFGNWNISAHQEKTNDDGEPSNTAGKPILSVISGRGVFNVLVVVTRFFGGTLLGVGGLIQAYSECTKQALNNAPYIKKQITKLINITYSYNQVSVVQYLFSKYDIEILSEIYDKEVQQKIAVNVAYFNLFINELVDKQIGYTL